MKKKKKKKKKIERLVKGRKREVKMSAFTVGVTLRLRGKYISFFSVDVVYGDVIICHWNQLVKSKCNIECVLFIYISFNL